MTYDCFMFNGEYDLLEIRFNILSPWVDRFIICEGMETFSGNQKPLYWAERNKDRFDEWDKKVDYVIVQKGNFEDSFKRAGFQKDSIRHALIDCSPNDLIYYGDVDEIWTPQTKKGKLRQLAYSYYLNNRSSEDWQGTNVCQYKDLYDLNEWRANHDIVLENGGWHFTNVGGYDQLLHKIESYDHQEVNIPWVKDGLQARIDANIDFLGRTHDWKGNPFEFWLDDTELPEYILNNKERYAKLWK